MSHTRKIAAVASVVAAAVIGPAVAAVIGPAVAPVAATTSPPVAPVAAATSPPVDRVAPALLVGELGFEGGAYPGGFHPTAGTVTVAFTLEPIVVEKPVGPSGRFRIPLRPGTYTVTGCGPSASATSSPLCGRPRRITLVAGEVDHIRLVWALAP